LVAALEAERSQTLADFSVLALLAIRTEVLMTRLESEYWRTCFVVMPYGKRNVAKRVVDFDTVYRDVFQKAIRRVKVNDTTALVPKRADDATHSRLLLHGMIQDLIQSRLILADLSANNTNVGLELGIRYSVVPSGTVLVRLKGTSIPFDFAAAQVTEYSHAPAEATSSRALIATALRETLKYNEVDNPYYEQAQELALRMGKPEKPTNLGNLLVDAEDAVRRRDLKTAIDKYAEAEQIEPKLAPLYVRRATLLIEGTSLKEASLEIRKALKINPDYLEASRWLREMKRGHVPRPVYLDPTSLGAVNAIIRADQLKKSKATLLPEVTLIPSWREDGSFEADFLIACKQRKQLNQIVESVSTFGRVKDRGYVILSGHEQMLQRFSVIGKKSSPQDGPDKMLGKIRTRTGIQGVKAEPIQFKHGGGFKRGGFKGGGEFGGGFGGVF